MANNQGRGIEDDEDDFEGFGGFETADPVPDMQPAQAQAAASPWALFNTGNIPGRPDLLCAQNRFPNYLDPSNITGPGAGAMGSDVNLNNVTGNPPNLPQADLLGGQVLADPARIAENVLDGTLNAGAGVEGFSHNHVNGRLPDLGLGTNEGRLFGQAGALLDPPVAGGREAVNQAQAPTPAPLELPNNAAALAQPVGSNNDLSGAQEGAAVGNRGDRPAAVDGGGTVAAGNVAAEGMQGEPGHAVPVAEVASSDQSGSSRNDALQQRVAALSEENERLEAELDRCRNELATQRSRQQEVEAQHQVALEEVRRAGHDALAVVVEQYKEQSKTVVLEQQEEARRQIAEVLREQMRAFQDMVQAQQDLQEQQKKEDKEELERQIAQAIEQSRREQQEQFQAFLAEEQENQRQATEKTLEEERRASHGKVQEAMAAEVELGRARLEEARLEASEKLEEERKNHEAALASVREEEKRLAKEQMAELAREERERSREVTRDAVEASRLESQSYLQEQRQADASVRRRHLISLDLFLESSRQQLALLMESERPQARALSPTPPPTARSSASNSSQVPDATPVNNGASSVPEREELHKKGNKGS